MSNHIPFAGPELNPASLGAQERYLGPGIVMQVEEADANQVQVALPAAEAWVEAQVALTGAEAVRRGQRVLVSVTEGGAAYVIGVLGEARRGVATRDGARAQVVEDEAGERIQLRDGEGCLLFEYDPARKTARVQVPRGDLELLAPEGEVLVGAGKGIRLTGQTVDLAATASLRALVHDPSSGGVNSLRMGRKGIRMDTEGLRVDARRGRFNVDRSQITGERVDAEVREIRTTAQRIWTTAESVTQRFGSLCRRVKGLFQSRAGRVRSLISGTWHARSDRADLRSEKIFKVDGSKIHLG